jgi:hypothetical protein
VRVDRNVKTERSLFPSFSTLSCVSAHEYEQCLLYRTSVTPEVCRSTGEDVTRYSVSPSSSPCSQQDRQCTYKDKIHARSRNHCCRGKAISTVLHILSVCLWPSVIILLSVACLALLYFSTLSHKRHDLRGGGGGWY